MYDKQHMGVCAELCAKEHGISREALDAHALRSTERFFSATQANKFVSEIVPVEVGVGARRVRCSLLVAHSACL